MKRLVSICLLVTLFLGLLSGGILATPSNTSFSTAITLTSTIGDEISITGIGNGQAQYYKVSASANQRIYVTLYNMSSNADFDVALYNASYSQVALSARYSTSTEYFTYKVLSAGYYYIKIKAADVPSSSSSCKFKVILTCGVKGTSTTNSSYNRTTAGTYMDTWYNGFNPAYNNYTNNGGDCTNYASQVLHESGLSKIGSDSSSVNCWFTYSESWKSATKFTNHWGTNSMGSGYKRAYSCEYFVAQDIIANYATFRENIKTGDIIQYCSDTDTSRYHTLVVRSKTNNDIKLSCHTQPSIDRSLLSDLNDNYTKIIVLIRVKMN